MLTLSLESVLLCLYLVNIEVTIVSTSLVKITDELHGFNETSWVVSGYLVTYTGKPGLSNARQLLSKHQYRYQDLLSSGVSSATS